jgi:hypothetical protein
MQDKSILEKDFKDIEEFLENIPKRATTTTPG